MNKILSRLFMALFLSAGMIYLACEKPYQPVYGPDHPDPNPTGLQPARLDSISPSTGYLKDVVTFYGSGFNETPVYNFVTFGSKTGEVLSASATQIRVKAPVLSDESVAVRVAVKGSELWSNESEFTFLPAVVTLDEEISWPNGIAVDDDGNVYVGSATDGVIFRITPEGEKTEFAHVPVNGSIHFGPNHYLYVCVKGEGKIVRVSPDGATTEDVLAVNDPVDFTWDKNQNLYVVANDIGVYKVVNNDTVRVGEVGSGKNVRVFDDHLYVNDIWNGTVIKFAITSTGLAEGEVILETDSPSTLEFDVDGTLYFAKAWETSLFTLNAEGDEDVMYEGELMTPMRYTAFKGKYLYIVYPGWADIGTVMKVYIGVDQAPDYGITH